MKIVAHILLIYFSIGACIPNSDFSQLLKVNDMMAHFDLHQKEAQANGETISFSDFLYIHFLNENNNHQHDENDSHENLPFQNITTSINFYLATNHSGHFLPQSHSEAILPFYNLLPQQGVVLDLFRPPSIT